MNRTACAAAFALLAGAALAQDSSLSPLLGRWVSPTTGRAFEVDRTGVVTSGNGGLRGRVAYQDGVFTFSGEARGAPYACAYKIAFSGLWMRMDLLHAAPARMACPTGRHLLVRRFSAGFGGDLRELGSCRIG